MRKRLDPWPSVADLFSGLLVASFAGLIIFTAVHQRQVAVASGEKQRVAEEANRILGKAQQALSRALGEKAKDCGTEICIDVSIQFALNKDEIVATEMPKLERACNALKEALANSQDRREIEIFIDGHTDQQQARRIAEGRARAMFNWRLSGGRASSVLYEFEQRGVSKGEGYRILAVGHADTWPWEEKDAAGNQVACTQQTGECYKKNRRTTFRLRADTQGIERRLRGR